MKLLENPIARQHLCYSDNLPSAPQGGTIFKAVCSTKDLRRIVLHTLTAESEEELKSLLIRVKGESRKAGFKLNTQKTKIMASGPITSWQIEEEKVEAVSDCIFLGSKITVDGDRSHEIKRRLLLGRKAMTNLDSILKSRSITLPAKARLVKAMDFPIVAFGCESWTACMHAQSLQLCPTLCDPWIVAHQTPLSMEFSRQEY